ncbi:MAG TPA: ABC transporter substrate-binding protein [Aggregatilineales bacterium]|jgi:ABC-type glycerol-3-phosphate transport system substrate-binding protein|nr:ABC transporter substrate-binding protein [Aggregatilineales bacterium]
MRNKWLVLLCVLALALGMVTATGAQEQQPLSGELVVSFWGSVDAYEQGLSDNRPWEATYNLIKQWDEMHEGVTVTFISQPIDGIYDRIRTQLISGTLPDLVAMYPSNSYLEGNLDLLVDLTPFMAEKNPYGQFDTWAEEFWYDQSLGLRDSAIPKDQVYFAGNSLPSNIGQLVMYYNIDAFEAAGVTERPESFAELLNACDSLKSSGVTPMFADAAGGPYLGWYSSWMGEQLLDPITQNIISAWGVEDGFSVVTEQMIAWAITNDVMQGTDPLLLELARLMKEMKDRCWNEDWQAADSTVDYFLTKRTAMTHNGFWMLPQYIESPDRDFEFGTFVFPVINAESSELAVLDTVRRWGGVEGGEIGNSFFIPQTTADNGKLELALDLLQFLTARTTNDQWCEPQFPPCVPKDQPIEEVLTDPIVQEQVYGFYNPTMSVETAVRGIGNSDWTPDGVFLRLFDLYATDGLTLEEFGAQLDAEYQRWAEKAIIDHPEWDTAAWPQP